MLREGDEPIPGYRLQKFLGRGQFGEVWKTTAPGGTSAALKFIDLKATQGNKELRGILRVKEIRHAHLMPITALWMLDEQGSVLSSGILESYDPGANTATTGTMIADSAPMDIEATMLVVGMLLGDKALDDRLEECQAGGEDGIPAEELLQYMEESAKGIDYLNTPQHNLGRGPVAIQHCDIKPANIMLVGGTAVVCDFGLARMLGDMSSISATATSMTGSPAYMAPECVSKKTSSSTDQYALAVTYFQLRTGVLPFEDQSYYAVLEAHRNGTLWLEKLTPAEQKVIRKATSVKPEDRYATSVEMVRALRRAVEGKPETTTTNGVGNLAIIGIVIVALGLGATYFLKPEWFRPQAVVPVSQARMLTIQVSPVNASVQVDGNDVEVSGEGVATYEVQPGQSATVTVNLDGYTSAQQTVSYDDVTDGYQIDLAIEAKTSVAARAMALSKSGQISEAAQLLATHFDTDWLNNVTPEMVVETGAQEGKKADLMLLEFSPTGKSLVASNMAGQVIILSAADPQKTPSVLKNEFIGQKMAWSANGEWFALGEADAEKLSIYQLKDGKSSFFGALDFPETGFEFDIVSTSDGFAAARNDGFSPLAWSADNPTAPWKLSDRQLGDKKKTIADAESPSVFELAASKKGQLLAVLGNPLWLVVDRAEPDKPAVFLPRPADDFAEAGVAIFSEDNKHLVVGMHGDEGSVHIIELAKPEAPIVFPAHASPVQYLTWLTSTRFVSATIEHHIKVWDLDSRTAVRTIQPPDSGVGVELRSLQTFGDRFLVALTASAVTIWDTEKEEPNGHVLKMPAGNTLRNMAIDPSGRWLAVGDINGKVHFWDLRWIQAIEKAREYNQ